MTNFCVTLWVWELWRTFEGQILDNYKQRATIITEIFIAVRGFCSVMMRCSLSYWTNASQGLNVDTVIWLKLYMFPRRRELPDCLTLFLPCKACEPRQKCSICSLPRSYYRIWGYRSWNLFTSLTHIVAEAWEKQKSSLSRCRLHRSVPLNKLV